MDLEDFFLRNHTIFSIDQSNDMRYRNRELTHYIKQKIITVEIYIYINKNNRYRKIGKIDKRGI